MNRKRPGPDRRASMSSKNCRVNKYGSPVCAKRKIARGTVTRKIITTSAVKTPLRESEIFILGSSSEIDTLEHPAPKPWTPVVDNTSGKTYSHSQFDSCV